MLDRIYGDAMSRHANRLFAFGTLPFKADGAGPRQKNDTDCGVFVIRNMQRYGIDWAATVNQLYCINLLICLMGGANEFINLD